MALYQEQKDAESRLAATERHAGDLFLHAKMGVHGRSGVGSWFSGWADRQARGTAAMAR